MAEVNLTYLHPSIVSNIDAEESTYAVADGVTTLFVADTFEKGTDNKVQLVTSTEEFLFKYGEPNYKKYGQAAYNVLRWLENQGQAYVLRVLPDDAKYAHAVLNIQVDVDKDGKKIKTSDGTLADYDDVTIRPVISYLRSNNTDLESLKKEITIDNPALSETVDGYSNNFIMAVYPTGRGSAYNNLGFRLTLNTSYDTIQESRVYNFEVIRFDEDSNINIIEGPFYVTFDADALTSSNESMFIENVVNRYSENLRVVFNTEGYEKVAELINPNVNPSEIDILTGKTRVGIDGKTDTFFSSVTNSNLDIHVSLQKYSTLGEPVTNNGDIVLNIPSYDDIVEQSIITLDNNVREKEVEKDSDKLGYMKEQYPKIVSPEYDTYLASIYSKDGEEAKGTIPSNIANITELTTKVTEAKTNFDADATEENYAKLYLAASNVDNKYIALLNECNKLNAAGSLLDVDYVEFLQDQKSLVSLMNNKDQINITALAHKNEIINISSEVLQISLGNYDGKRIDEVNYIVSEINDEMLFTYNNILYSVYGNEIPEDVKKQFTDTADETTIVSKYNTVIKTISDIYSGYIVEDDYINEMLENINTILDYLTNTITSAMAKNLVDCITEGNKFINSFDEYSEVLINNVKEAKTVTETKTKEDIIEDARFKIDSETSTIVANNSKLYNNNLQNFANPIKLSMGSDGSFDYDTIDYKTRQLNIKNELIKAYKGLIDSDIINKKLIEFDHVLDCNYDVDVKNAIVSLARDIRGDFFFWADTGIQASPQDVIDWRQSEFNVASRHVGIFAQDMTYYDSYTGKDIKFTTPYALSQKIPYNAINYGLHYPIAGPRRGLLDGFKSLCWSPNESYKEQLYKAKVNYIEQDSRRTKIGCQLTTDSKNGPLSNINNVLTILKLQRNIEKIVEDYQFEFNDAETRSSLYSELTNYVATYITNRSCETIDVEVIASDYDKQQKILRVNISVKFNDVIERIVLNFSVQK